MNGLISYLPEFEVAVAYGYTHSLHYMQIQLIFDSIIQYITTFWFPVRRSSCHSADYLSI